MTGGEAAKRADRPANRFRAIDRDRRDSGGREPPAACCTGRSRYLPDRHCAVPRAACAVRTRHRRPHRVRRDGRPDQGCAGSEDRRAGRDARSCRQVGAIPRRSWCRAPRAARRRSGTPRTVRRRVNPGRPGRVPAGVARVRQRVAHEIDHRVEHADLCRGTSCCPRAIVQGGHNGHRSV
jgi:hypothetical protein